MELNNSQAEQAGPATTRFRHQQYKTASQYIPMSEPIAGTSSLRSLLRPPQVLAHVLTWVRTPQHVVARWLGHSENVALKHYLSTTDDDFLRAADVPHQAGEKGEAVGRSTQAKQHAAAPNRTKSPAQQKTPAATGVMLVDATHREMMQTEQAPPVGLEPTTRRLTAACSTN